MATDIEPHEMSHLFFQLLLNFFSKTYLANTATVLDRHVTAFGKT